MGIPILRGSLYNASYRLEYYVFEIIGGWAHFPFGPRGSSMSRGWFVISQLLLEVIPQPFACPINLISSLPASSAFKHSGPRVLTKSLMSCSFWAWIAFSASFCVSLRSRKSPLTNAQTSLLHIARLPATVLQSLYRAVRPRGGPSGKRLYEREDRDRVDRLDLEPVAHFVCLGVAPLFVLLLSPFFLRGIERLSARVVVGSVLAVLAVYLIAALK